MEDVFKIVTYGMILIFILGIVYMLGINLIGGHIYPMIKSESFLPKENSTFSRTQYLSTANKLYSGLKWFFYILVAIPFVYIAMKLLYEKEETSVYYGG